MSDDCAFCALTRPPKLTPVARAARQKTSQREQGDYQSLQSSIEGVIQRTRQEIGELKVALKAERLERRHKEECELLVRKINQLESRAAELVKENAFVVSAITASDQAGEKVVTPGTLGRVEKAHFTSKTVRKKNLPVIVLPRSPSLSRAVRPHVASCVCVCVCVCVFPASDRGLWL